MTFAPAAASRGYPPVAVCGLLTVVASLVAEHRLWGALGSVVVVCRFSSCNSWALEDRFSSCGG